MKNAIHFIICLFIFISCTGCNQKKTTVLNSGKNDSPEKDHLYISNGTIKAGLDLSAGGSLFFLGEEKTGRNLINHYDKGRFIQQSYYGIEDGSNWNGQPWTWNPIQGGGYLGQASKIIDRTFDGSALYIKSTPKHWATGEDITDAVMEQTIVLEEKTLHIHYAFTYNGTTNHPSRHQELPAVFVDAALPNLVYYDGNSPWTGDTLTRRIPGWPNEAGVSGENWAAYTDDNGWGIGVYTPGTAEMTTYRFKGDGKQGPQGSACSYFAPLRTFAVIPGMRFEYDVYITIGTTDEIRGRFTGIHDSMPLNE